MFAGHTFHKLSQLNPTREEAIALGVVKNLFLTRTFNSSFPSFKSLSRTNSSFFYPHWVQTKNLPKEMKWNQCRKQEIFIDEGGTVEIAMSRVFTRKEPANMQRTKVWLFRLTITEPGPTAVPLRLGLMWCQKGCFACETINESALRIASKPGWLFTDYMPLKSPANPNIILTQNTLCTLNFVINKIESQKLYL